MYIRELFDISYEMYANDIKILNDNPNSIVDETDPQSLLEEMKKKSLSMVCFNLQCCTDFCHEEKKWTASNHYKEIIGFFSFVKYIV